MSPTNPQGFARGGGEFQVNGVDDQTILIDTPMIVDALSVVPRNMGVSEGNPLVLAGDGYPPFYDNRQRVWHGNIAEVIMYDQALTDVQRGQVGYYLEQKYGLDTVYTPPVPSLTMTDIAFTVVGDSTLHADSDTTADLGTLILESGTVTLTGAPDGLTFTGTTVDANATAVGLNPQTSTDLQVIDGSNAEVVITKYGDGTLVLDEVNVNLDRATFEAQGGRLEFTQPASLAGAALQINGGLAVLGGGGDVTYDNAVVVTGDGTLTVSGGDVTLGSATNGVTVNDGTLTLHSTADYTLDIAGTLTGESVTLTEGNVKLAGANLAKLKIAGGKIDAGSSQIVIRGELNVAGEDGRNDYAISPGDTFSVTGSDVGSARLITLDAGTLTIGRAGGYPGNPMGVWTFDDGTADDSTENEYHGEMVGGTFTTGDTAFAGSAGAIDLTQGNHYVMVSDGVGETDFDVDQLSVSVWVRGWPGSNWGPFVTKYGESGIGWQFRRFGDQNGLCFTMRGAGGDFGGAIDWVGDGDWHHIVATYDGENQTIYVDGEEDATRAQTGDINDASGHMLVFGAYNNNNTGTTFGNFSMVELDDIFIYDRGLSAEEVATLYGDGEGLLPSFVVEMADTSLHITGDSTVFAPTEEEALLGNLTLDTGVSLAIVNDLHTMSTAAVELNDLTAGDGTTLQAHLLVTGVLSAGTLLVTELELGDDARYIADVGGGTSDLVEIMLDGFLAGELVLNGISQPGAAFGVSGLQIMRTVDDEGAIIEEFAVVPAVGDHVGTGLFAADPDGDGSVVTYGDTSIEVDVFQSAAGDTNGDREINNIDLQGILAANSFNNPGDWEWIHGDFDGDGGVDNRDLQLVLATGYFGQGDYTAVAPASGVLVVPEPATLVLLASGLLGLLLKLWHRRKQG